MRVGRHGAGIWMFSAAGLLFGAGILPLDAQEIGSIRSITIGPSNTVRLVVQPATAPSDNLCLQSAASPLGPWANEAHFVRNPSGSGDEFLTPQRSYYPRRFYRFGWLSQSPLIVENLPYIRFISPNAKLQRGQSFTLLGANFDPDPGKNVVTFEVPNQSWVAPVTEAATQFLVGTVPTNLTVGSASTGSVFRVTVRTPQGTGNGVGCSVVDHGPAAFSIRPDSLYIAQAPGSGRQKAIVGGGTPPYHLVAQSASDLQKVVATLNGPILELTAAPSTEWGSFDVTVTDSSPGSANEARASVYVLSVEYRPGLEATFHTLEAGTAPGVTLTATLSDSSNGNLQTASLELQLQNAGIELGRLRAGSIAGLLQLLDPGYAVYGYQHLIIKEVSAGRARFDVVSMATGEPSLAAEGEFIQSPPTVVINVLNLKPAVLVAQPLSLELILTDGVFRLPSQAGEAFSMTAEFTSVSAREDFYVPQHRSVTNRFATTGVPPTAPRIERLLPVQGEIYRHVRIRGASFGADPMATHVTFAAADGGRAPAEIISQTESEIEVFVPSGAVTGPVRVKAGDKNSNDFVFYARFHPDTVLLIERSGTNNAAGLILRHQQPVDDGPTSGEVPIQTVSCKLGAGHIAVESLTVDQAVGNVISTSFYDGRRSTNVLVYAGRDTSSAQRHIFQQRTGSRYALGILYYSEDAEGVSLEMVSGQGIFGCRPGASYDFELTAPIYLPPVDGEVPVRVEAISQAWTSIPANEMHVIWNSLWHAE